MGKVVKKVTGAIGLGGDDSAARALEEQQRKLLQQQQATQALQNANVAAESATVDSAGTADAQSVGVSTKRRRSTQSLSDQLGLNV